MKNIRILVLAIIIACTQIGAAQDVMQLERFDQISATGIIEMTLVKGNEEKIELETDDFDRCDVKVRVEDGILRINVTKSLVKDADIKITVYYKQLRRIKVNAGVELFATDPIEIDKLELKANSGAQIELELKVNDLKARLAEGAQMHLSGTTESQTVTCSSGAIFYGHNLKSDYTYVNANTGARAEVVALMKMEATANTGGRVCYKGDPSDREIKDFLGGDVFEF